MLQEIGIKEEKNCLLADTVDKGLQLKTQSMNFEFLE